MPGCDVAIVLRLIFLLPLAAGIGCAVVGFRNMRLERRLRTRGGTVQGTVVDNLTAPGQNGRISYRPVAEYVTSSGEVRRAAASFRSSRSFALGAPIRVSYDPIDPQGPTIVGRPQSLLLFVGATLLILGAIALALIGNAVAS